MVHPAFGISETTRQQELAIHRIVVTEMRGRVFGSFARIHEEIEELMARHRAELGPDEVPWYVNEDGDVGDEAEDAGVDRYLELEYVLQEVIHAAVTALYHSWEKPVRRLVAKQAGLLKLSKTKTNDVERGPFAALCNVITEFGCWDIRKEPFFAKLDQLRMAANIIKHESREDTANLYKVNSRLFDSSVWPEAYPTGSPPVVTPEHLRLSEEDYMDFAAAIEGFWAGYPTVRTRLPAASRE